MRADVFFALDLDFDGEVAGVDGLGPDAGEETVGEAVPAHPAEVLGSQIGVCDGAEGLAEKGEEALRALCDGDEVHWLDYAFDDGEGGGAGRVSAGEVPAHGVSRAAGELADCDRCEGVGCIGALREPVEHLVRHPVAGDADDCVVGGEGDVFCDVDGMAGVGGGFDGEGAAGGGEERFAVLREHAGGGAGAADRVDEDFKAFVGERGAVGEGEEVGSPFFDRAAD